MRQKLNLITLGVSDFDKAVEFYEKGLGWKKSSASVEELALFPWAEWFWLCIHEKRLRKMQR
jgi:catechol 2,3-dioxygenase-like lactoylglutathione lyase family enzyme